MKTVTSRIKICEVCVGVGKVWEIVSGYDSEHVACNTCKGSGRIKTTITVEEEPYMK